MCGIYGQVSDQPQSSLLRHAEYANEQLAHRGPNGAGVRLGKGYCLAHRRLAIFDTSDLGAQPMTGWGHTIVFNGAVYNWMELRSELEKAGYHFRSQTDTEVILAAFDCWGTDCFARFNGMWALAIVSPDKHSIVLSRDRFGIKPLYYTVANGLTFGSEPKLVATTAYGTAKINLRVAGEFVEFGWQDHRPETLYEGVYQFPPGHFVRVDMRAPQDFTVQPFHDLDAAADSVIVPDSREGAIAELRTLLIDSVRLRTRSDVGRCVTLSGGIDSSSIAGIMAAHTSSHPRTYSALFTERELDESRYVTAVNRKHGLRGEVFQPTYEEVLDSYAATQRAQGQPIASLAVVVHHQLMRLIREHGERVLLNGQGADEIGAGYDKFYLPLLREELRRNPLSALRTTLLYATRQDINVKKAISRLGGRWKQSARTSPSITGRYFEGASEPAFCRSADHDVFSTSVNLLREVGLPVLLRHEDRNTMAFGLESRAPFMDHRVVEYLLALPAGWKIHRAVRKDTIREACREELPTEVYRRYKKLGFPTPAANWMERDADRYLAAITKGVKLGYFSELTGVRCHRIMRTKARSDYNLVFRCFSWMRFVEHQS